jgi:hypothetical protein
MKRLILVAGVLALAAGLSATPAAAATNPPPTATPLPKAKSNDAYRLINPASTKKVVFGELQEFTHPSGIFTIMVPENWGVQDGSSDDASVVYFLDPGKNAAIIARAVVVADSPDNDAIGQMLQTYVEDQFGGLKKYQAEDPKKMKNGDMGMGFSFDATAGGKTYTMYGDAYAFLNDPVASTLVFIGPKDQYDDIRDQAYEVLNSYKANPDALGSNAGSEDIIGEMSLYKDKKGAFQILAPDGWEPKDQSKAGQSVVGFVQPDGKAELVVEVYKDAKTYKPADLQKLVEAYVEDSYSKQSNMQMSNSEGAGNTAKASATFDLEVGNETIPMVAVLYVDKVPGALAYMRIAVPVSSLDAVKDKMDQIGESYKLTKNPKL